MPEYKTGELLEQVKRTLKAASELPSWLVLSAESAARAREELDRNCRAAYNSDLKARVEKADRVIDSN